MKIRIAAFAAAAAIFGLIACNNNQGSNNETKDAPAELTEQEISVDLVTDTLNNFAVYRNNTALKPIVLIVPEWWGLDDYVKGRARQLAELGYLAVGVDMYGKSRTASNPDEALRLASPFYQDPSMGTTRLEAALMNAKTLPNADTTRIAAIGYCFGGSMVLNGAKMGLPLNGVVSFHGGLAGVAPQKDLVKAQILVCHGDADPLVPEQDVVTFKRQLDSLGIAYTFKSYPNATHAFTNPKATENGKKFNMPIEYNAAADTASWNDMLSFFGEVLR